MYLEQKSAFLCTSRPASELDIRCKVLDPELKISLVIVLSSFVDTLIGRSAEVQHTIEQQKHTKSIGRAHFPVVVLSWHVVQCADTVSIDYIA